MLIASDAIRKKLPSTKRHFWEQDNRWLTDTKWFLPDHEEAISVLKEEASKLPPASFMVQCEDTAIMIVGRVRERRAREAKSGEKANWPLGFAMGEKFRGLKKNHTTNIIITKKGVFLFDAREGTEWELSDDSLYFYWF